MACWRPCDAFATSSARKRPGGPPTAMELASMAATLVHICGLMARSCAKFSASSSAKNRNTR